MGRLLAALLLPSALVAGRPQPSSGVDVLNRTLLLLESGSSALLAPAQLVQVASADVPRDVATALDKANVSWSQLSDVMRVGVLWAHGYALVGSSSTQLAPVYTYCDSPGDALDAVNGRYMDETVVAASDFAAAKCSSNTCGTFQQATNANCDEAALTRAITCAVDTNATKIPSSGASVWSNASSLTSVPVPKLFTHTLTSSKNLTLVSIHMASSVGETTQCGSSGDAVAPCFVLDDANKKNFCRPKIDHSPLKTLLETIAAKLAPTPAPTTAVETKSSSSSGLSIGAIIGIAAGAAVVLGLVGFYFFRKKKTEPEPDYPGVGRKSSVGGGLHGSGPAFVAIHEKKKPSGVRRQGTSTSSNFPVIDSGRDNDTVQTTDYMDNLDEDSRQRPFTRNLLQSGDQSMLQSGSDMMRSGRSDSLINSFRGEGGKTIEDYCEESEIIREFLNDPVIKLRRIPYEELTTLRILSKGSYGEVYLGQLETRHVAMKRLLPEKKHLTKCIELFTGEIRIMCYLEHRNIVTFVGVSWNYLQNICVVVEYMDNGDLAEVLTKMKNKYTWEKEKIGIAMDIAEGLVYLHSMRPVIVHRDLKSKNVLLNKRGQAKLSDFGVSRKTTVNETMTSGVGTLLWTAPEIIEGRKYSEKADIFSLGVVLSEIDTCEEPYSTVTNEETGERLPGMQIVQMVRTGQLTVSLRDGCPAKIRELVQQCTSLDPDKRPTSMEVAYTLKSIIAPSLRATQ